MVHELTQHLPNRPNLWTREAMRNHLRAVYYVRKGELKAMWSSCLYSSSVRISRLKSAHISWLTIESRS